MSHEYIRRKSIPGRENSKCKVYEIGISFVCVPGTASKTEWLGLSVRERVADSKSKEVARS